MENKWYLNTWFIALLFAAWFLIIPPIVGCIFIFMKQKEDRQTQQKYEILEMSNTKLTQEKEKLSRENQEILREKEEIQKRNDELGIDDYSKIKAMAETMELDYSAKKLEYEKEQSILTSSIAEATEELEKLLKATKTQSNKLNRFKELNRAVQYSLKNFFEYEPDHDAIIFSDADSDDVEELCPSVFLKLHCMDVKSLSKAYRENDRQITAVLQQYAARYTTKANQAIYNLMVIALRAELQNILYNLKYEKLDKALDTVKAVSQKYLKIAGEGNQSIAGTLTKFIGEIEYLFSNAVKIEYNYYVKKEQAKQEQAAIREQIKQEAAERKALENEKKKIEKEEEKYNNEINKLTSQLDAAETAEQQKLKQRILELEAMLSDVVVKKTEIAKLQNGKAGNVYIISNLGSFGENVFKVGMTRRLDPQDRVNELGDASVPFKFDVHSFIFSEDAVDLEFKLHKRLSKQRVNKVNARKEFFYSSIDELETLVNEIDPTAEFNKTMLAEEFRQSQSSTDVYSSELETDEYDDEDSE